MYINGLFKLSEFFWKSCLFVLFVFIERWFEFINVLVVIFLNKEIYLYIFVIILIKKVKVIFFKNGVFWLFGFLNV